MAIGLPLRAWGHMPRSAGTLTLRGYINPVASICMASLMGFAIVAGIVDTSSGSTARQVVLISCVLGCFVVFALRSSRLRVVCKEDVVVIHGHFRNQTVPVRDVRAVNVEAYEGWLSRGPTEMFWMLVLSVRNEADEGKRDGHEIELRILASRKLRADRFEKSLRTRLRL